MGCFHSRTVVANTANHDIVNKFFPNDDDDQPDEEQDKQTEKNSFESQETLEEEEQSQPLHSSTTSTPSLPSKHKVSIEKILHDDPSVTAQSLQIYIDDDDMEDTVLTPYTNIDDNNNMEEEKTEAATFDDIYERGKELGSGAFATVFIGKHKRTGRTYAIKEVIRSKMQWNNRDRLQDEINILMTLRGHSNIIQLYNVFEKNNDDLCYLVTGLLAGGELFQQIVERKTFTEMEARDCCRCILSALDFIHKRRIVHRDLKPENLLLSDKNNLLSVTVADFGFATLVKEKNGCRTFCGTLSYIAPEILARWPSYDVECDIWSFGVILFLLLGGYLPFDGDDDLKIINQTKRGDYFFYPHAWVKISTSAKNLVARCLTIDPTKRISASEILQHDWMGMDDTKLIGKEVDILKLKQSLVVEAQKKVRAATNALVAINRLKQINANVYTNNKKSILIEQSMLDSTSGKSFHELYDIGDLLDEGGFSKVYKCTRKGNTSLTYAVKHVILDNKSDDVVGKVALKEEISALTLLRGGPAIIRLYDVFNTDPNNFYLILEECKGGNLLYRIIEKEVYTEYEARQVCRTLLQAIDYCHKKHIAHRDIKAENILLTEKDDDTAVKLVDFGFAKKITGEKSLITQCGTPSYIAPEIINVHEEGGYDHRCDLWSAGIVAFVLLGGYLPFYGSSKSIFLDITKGKFVFHEKYWNPISDSAKDMIRSLLQVQPNNRATAEEVLSCDWMARDEESLRVRDLSKSQVLMKDTMVHLKKNDKMTVQMKMSIENEQMSSGGVARKGIKRTRESLKVIEEGTKGKTFNNLYEWGSQIKNGTFSAVHKTTHRQTCESFVVKRVTRKGLQPIDAVALHEEIAALQLLKDSDYAIKLQDLYDEPDFTFLVLECTRGGNLLDRIEKKTSQRYTEYDAKQVSRNLIRAVAHCHQKKIAHRNLNPTNILFPTESDDTNIKIGGFDCAKIVKFSNSLRTLCGMDGYIYTAPEVLAHLPKYDIQCDMWSVGVILYVMICGYCPFEGEDKNVIRQICYGEFIYHRRYWKHVSKEAKELISLMLTVDPSLRVTAQDALESSWIQSDNPDLAVGDNKIEEKNRKN